MAEYIRKQIAEPTAQETIKIEQKAFEMVKNFRGSYGVMIDPYDFSMPARRFSFRFDTDSQFIPIKFALGVFITNEASRAMERGLFTFKNLDLLIEMAEEKGLYIPDSIKQTKILAKDLRKLLIANDIKGLEKIMMNANKNDISNLVHEAKKQLSVLNINIVEYIEKKYKVTLKPINLDE